MWLWWLWCWLFCTWLTGGALGALDRGFFSFHWPPVMLFPGLKVKTNLRKRASKHTESVWNHLGDCKLTGVSSLWTNPLHWAWFLPNLTSQEWHFSTATPSCGSVETTYLQVRALTGVYTRHCHLTAYLVILEHVPHVRLSVFRLRPPLSDCVVECLHPSFDGLRLKFGEIEQGPLQIGLWDFSPVQKWFRQVRQTGIFQPFRFEFSFCYVNRNY